MFRVIARWAWCIGVVDLLLGLAFESFIAIIAGVAALVFFELGGGHR